ncbi:hypothetical protein [Halobacillus sp. A5]|uniref:hypothetical protein n=1 Tax=Halobacillus sp. A5 TaxID=2880263 RepID=UPI0020A627E3|nr:hypothetical protein [Halobacillus sp. A5]MCP3027289.1 hypothetical protein [Halobacillus sp. A5]
MDLSWIQASADGVYPFLAAGLIKSKSYLAVCISIIVRRSLIRVHLFIPEKQKSA